MYCESIKQKSTKPQTPPQKACSRMQYTITGHVFNCVYCATMLQNAANAPFVIATFGTIYKNTCVLVTLLADNSIVN